MKASFLIYAALLLEPLKSHAQGVILFPGESYQYSFTSFRSNSSYFCPRCSFEPTGEANIVYNGPGASMQISFYEDRFSSSPTYSTFLSAPSSSGGAFFVNGGSYLWLDHEGGFRITMLSGSGNISMFTVSSTTYLGNTANTSFNTVIPSVPEPALGSFVALGILAFVFFGRRK